MNREKMIDALEQHCKNQETCSECRLEFTPSCRFRVLDSKYLTLAYNKISTESVTSNLTGVVKEAPKTVSEILEEVSNQICDHYCKYPNEITDQEEMQQKCFNCPLQKLN